MAQKPTTTAPAQTTTAGTPATTDKRPLPISSSSRDLTAKLVAERTGLPIDKVQGVRLYHTAAVKLSEVIVKYVDKWLKTSTLADTSNKVCPSLAQLLAPPDGVTIRLIVGWKDNKPIEDDFIAKRVLQARMKDMYAALVVPVKGNTSIEFTPSVPLLNRDKNSASKAVVEAFENLHLCEPGLTKIRVVPDLMGESESELLARRAKAAAKQLSS